MSRTIYPTTHCNIQEDLELPMNSKIAVEMQCQWLHSSPYLCSDGVPS